MELRQLRYFVAVFNHRSISRAAEQLLISQPALTRQIRHLEHECGISLFERLSTGVAPTSAGAALHKHALTMLALADSARDAARQAGPVRQPVDIGLTPGLPTSWVDRLLTTLKQHVPLAEISFTDADTTSQLRMVREGRLDVGLVHQEPPPELMGHKVGEAFYGLAFRPQTPIPDSGTCPWSEADGMRVLVHSRDQFPLGHDRLLAMAHTAEVAPLWQFASYTEHALACADVTGSAAVLLTQTSAARLLPGWSWRQLTNPAITLETWVIRQPLVRNIVRDVTEMIQTNFQPSP